MPFLHPPGGSATPVNNPAVGGLIIRNFFPTAKTINIIWVGGPSVLIGGQYYQIAANGELRLSLPVLEYGYLYNYDVPPRVSGAFYIVEGIDKVIEMHP